MANQEFSVAGAYAFDRRGPVRWIASHLLRYKAFLAGMAGAIVLSNVLNSAIPALTGQAFNVVLRRPPTATPCC